MSAGTSSPIAATFAERAASVGTEVHASTRAGCCPLIASLLRREGAQRVALDAEALTAISDLAPHLSHAGFEVVAELEAATLAQLDAGIAWAAFGVAETGSVALAARAPGSRLVSMLPPIHLVLARESGLVPDLDTAMAQLRAWTAGPVQQPYVSLVTGASRTSDIERVLTIGVHGPRVQHVILLSDE